MEPEVNLFSGDEYTRVGIIATDFSSQYESLKPVNCCGLVATSQLTTSSTSRSEWSEVNIFGGGEYTEVGKIATDYRPVRVPEVSLVEVLLVGT